MNYKLKISLAIIITKNFYSMMLNINDDCIEPLI